MRAEDSLAEIPGVGSTRADQLAAAGYETVEDVASASVDELGSVISQSKAPGIREAAKVERGDDDTLVSRLADELDVPRSELATAYGQIAPLGAVGPEAEETLRLRFEERRTDTVADIEGYSLRWAHLLRLEGFETLDDVTTATVDELTSVTYVGDSLAETLQAAARESQSDDSAVDRGGATGGRGGSGTAPGGSAATDQHADSERADPEADLSSPDDAFPYDSYRPYQRAALYEASQALFETEGIDTVVLNLPTGIGKSAINTALARQAESAFLTTPQKALRTQLEEDRDLRPYYSVLRAREDYSCPAGSRYGSAARNYDCRDCPINRADEESCLAQDDCTYWNRKEQAMADPTAVLTFSYLIVDGHLPEHGEGAAGGDGGAVRTTRQISFGDRDLLVVDECHKLEEQVASLHAGISVSPYSLPTDAVFGDVDSDVGALPDDRITKFEHVQDALEKVYSRARSYVDTQSSALGEESEDVRRCRNFCLKYEWCREQVEAGRDWVVDRTEQTLGGETRYAIEIIPVDVDEFLRERVWSRADKQVLSTATMPFSGSPDRWLDRLGLDPDRTVVVQYPMPFPERNRQVRTETIVGQMSQGGYSRHRDAIVDELRRLARRHDGEKGLIHTASYERARDLAAAFPENGRCHSQGSDDDLRTQLDAWRRSDSDMFFSPAATDGVDLPGDECRWQALVKVPYPNPGDPRVQFLLDERNDWEWYYEVTSQTIQQSVGRGVRSMDDACTYYVLDGSFTDVMDRATAPEWFRDSIRT